MCKRSSRATRTGKARRSSSSSSATSSQTYLRAHSLTRNQAHALLVEAEKRLTGLVSLPHARALRVAEQFGVSAYDARFLGTAQSFKTRLVTEDARLRKAAPALTISLSHALAA